ncbi:MAG: hypothetical protein RLZZ192_722 [Pseudomonadota bacterium]
MAEKGGALKSALNVALETTISRAVCIHCASTGVSDGARTRDNQNHNLGLYQLSYAHHRSRILACLGTHIAVQGRLGSRGVGRGDV